MRGRSDARASDHRTRPVGARAWRTAGTNRRRSHVGRADTRRGMILRVERRGAPERRVDLRRRPRVLRSLGVRARVDRGYCRRAHLSISPKTSSRWRLVLLRMAARAGRALFVAEVPASRVCRSRKTPEPTVGGVDVVSERSLVHRRADPGRRPAIRRCARSTARSSGREQPQLCRTAGRFGAWEGGCPRTRQLRTARAGQGSNRSATKRLVFGDRLRRASRACGPHVSRDPEPFPPDSVGSGSLLER